MGAARRAHSLENCLPLWPTETKRCGWIQTRLVCLIPRGLVHLRMGRWDAAVRDFNAALQLDPTLPSSLYGRGFAKIKQGVTTAGKVDISRAAKLEPNIAIRFSRYGVQ